MEPTMEELDGWGAARSRQAPWVGSRHPVVGTAIHEELSAVIVYVTAVADRLSRTSSASSVISSCMSCGAMLLGHPTIPT